MKTKSRIAHSGPQVESPVRLETRAQEIAAIILATALIARQRARAANGQVPVLRVKFDIVLAVVRSMWFYVPRQAFHHSEQWAVYISPGSRAVRSSHPLLLLSGCEGYRLTSDDHLRTSSGSLTLAGH